jgi:hypothetical protein
MSTRAHCSGLSLLQGYNAHLGARSSMDRIRVSEALDTGSIPVGRANPPLGSKPEPEPEALNLMAPARRHENA